jgi:hypothetical protein
MNELSDMPPSRGAAERLSQTIEWLGIRFQVPAEWEIVRHTLDVETGSVVLVDRREQRLTISWTRCANKPDLERLVGDYEKRELESSPDVERFSLRDWQGIYKRTERSVVQAVTFDEPTSRLVEAVMVGRDRTEVEAWARKILPQLRVISRAEVARRFCAFGLDVTAPVGYRPSSLKVLPAEVAIEFQRYDDDAKEPTRDLVKVYRFGMADLWFVGARHALAQHEPARFLETQSVDYRGHSAECFDGMEKGPPLRRMFGRLRKARALCWHSKSENAVYAAVAYAASGEPDPQAFRIESGWDSGDEAAALEVENPVQRSA